MKVKNLLLYTLITISVAVSAQQGTSVSQIPADVQATLQRNYPTATNVTWEQDESYFIPVFMNNNTATKLLIDPKGTLVHTSVKISPSALPAAVTTYLSSNYSGQTVTDAEQLTMINHTIRYEVVVSGKDMIFDSTGKFLKIVSGPLKQ